MASVRVGLFPPVDQPNGDKIVKTFVMDDSLKGVVFCDPSLPESAGNGTGLTNAQLLSALKGGL